MSKPLPIGWRLEPLRRLAQVVSGGTPSRYVPEFWEGGSIPWVTPTDITSSNDRFLHETREHITELGLQSCSAKKLPPGTLLMTSRATLGEVRIALGEVCTNQGFKSLIPLKGIDGQFLFYQVGLNKERYKGFGIGSTFLEVNKRDTERFELLVAPEKEQRRIADILSTLDEAIEQTEALIAKYQQIKAGLMQDLFTRGLFPEASAKGDVTWTLRPTRAQSPHLYKESPLGWVPKEWEVSTLGESCEWFSGGTPSRSKSEWWSGDFPWLTPKDMKAFELSDTSEHITKEAALFGSRVVSAGTVFIVVRGMILAHSFPVVLGLKDFAFNQDIKAVQAMNRLGSRFMAYWFVGHTDLFLRKTTEATHGTKRFDLQEISKVSIGLPKLDEQNAIVSRLDSISMRIDSEQALVAKLRQQKHGLMHDLLTGRVCVKAAETASI